MKEKRKPRRSWINDINEAMQIRNLEEDIESFPIIPKLASTNLDATSGFLFNFQVMY